MRILAIETSCDETAMALLDIAGDLSKPEIKILGNSLFSQAHLHEQYGGVFPTLAKREHIKNLPILLDKVLEEAKSYELTADSLDLIAVTSGPGLEPALWAGITFAQELGEKWGKPVLGIDHMKGHVYSVLYQAGNNQGSITNNQLELPALALLVSGGHTELVLVKDWQNFEILGKTLDDAVGEAFDKVARMLGLSYPGGPKISALAEESRSKNQEARFKFPRPMINSGDLNFSYSGLKTAVLYKIRELGELSDGIKMMIAREFEDAAIEVLVEKTRRALESHNVRTLIIGGGVAASKYLREQFNGLIVDFPDIALRIPERALTTDNAVMIGLAAYVEASKYPELLTNRQKLIARGNKLIDSE